MSKEAMKIANKDGSIELISSQLKDLELNKLIFAVDIVKVNRKYKLFQTRKPRKVFLFETNPIELVYYMPSKRNPDCTRILLDSTKSISFNEELGTLTVVDNNTKISYVFQDDSNKTKDLYTIITELKEFA